MLLRGQARTLMEDAGEMFRFLRLLRTRSKGNGFGPIGEENAWSSHSMMYSPLAAAMTTETRAQFAWTFYSGANRQDRENKKVSQYFERE